MTLHCAIDLCEIIVYITHYFNHETAIITSLREIESESIEFQTVTLLKFIYKFTLRITITWQLLVPFPP